MSDRLIVALDVPRAGVARRLVERLGDEVVFYKIGMELVIGGEHLRLLDWLVGHGKKVLMDLKLFDIPRTVGAVVDQLSSRGASYITVHGCDEMLVAACRYRGATGILAVTVLTSLCQSDMREFGLDVDIEALVLSRARRARRIGCSGVISSGLEVPALRRELDPGLVVVVPGIRPVSNIDDHRRTVDVDGAIRGGADHIVVGRPILKSQDPLCVVQDIQERIRRMVT